VISLQNKPIKILVVDDEWNMRNLMKMYLERQGWLISEASDGTEAIEKVKKESFHLMILDIMMPGMDGWEVCRYLREEEENEIPILLLTARNETKDKVQGLNLGADDYLTKPFDIEELIARIHALLRRHRSFQSQESKINIGEITILPDSREVIINDGLSVLLTPKEYDVFYLLAKHPNKAFERRDLLDRVWGYDFEGDARTVDQHIKNIREKLKKSGCTFNPIKTVWGLGYQIQRKSYEK
jgi:two-component system response regulator ResD